jgi:glucose-6-phosphate isomerase
MSLQKINPSTTEAWEKLRDHFYDMQTNSIKEMFANDPYRAEKFHIQWDDFLVDYSKNNINQKTLDLLLELANEVGLKEAIESYFSGGNINQTEDRAVLHTALRANENEEVFVDGKNVIPEIYEVKEKINVFSKEVISGNKKGYTNKAFTDVVNIGIGGSDLGPAMVVEALQI